MMVTYFSCRWQNQYFGDFFFFLLVLFPSVTNIDVTSSTCRIFSTFSWFPLACKEPLPMKMPYQNRPIFLIFVRSLWKSSGESMVSSTEWHWYSYSLQKTILPIQTWKIVNYPTETGFYNDDFIITVNLNLDLAPSCRNLFRIRRGTGMEIHFAQCGQVRDNLV